jgi:beta-lactamase regulating signal transducer with metallopeptidase domain
MNFVLVVSVLCGFAFAVAWGLGLVFSTAAGVALQRSARLAFAAGVLPLASAIGFAVLCVAPALLVYEPRETREVPGIVLMVTAVFGLLLAVRTVIRVAGMMAATRRVTRQWAAGAEPMRLLAGVPTLVIDASNPIVAVGGVVSPVLYLDRRVLHACSTEELRAIADHELAHIEAGDNTKRLLLAATRGMNHRVVSAWRDASECEADQFAAVDEERGLALASALVKVARAGRLSHLQGLAVSGIQDGGAIDQRVRALLAGVSSRRPRRRPLLRLLPVIAVAIAAPLTWKPMHDMLEIVLHVLP